MTRERLPGRRAGEAFDFEHGGFRYTAAAGFYDDGRLGEVFLSASVKSGTPIEGSARDEAILLSLLLQHGCPLELVWAALTRDGFDMPSTAIGALCDELVERALAGTVAP